MKRYFTYKDNKIEEISESEIQDGIIDLISSLFNSINEYSKSAKLEVDSRKLAGESLKQVSNLAQEIVNKGSTIASIINRFEDPIKKIK